MAKVRQNMVMQGLSGTLGDQLVIRIDKAGRTIVSAKAPDDPNRVFNDVQKAHQEEFRQAAAYAKAAKGEEVYAQKAQGTPLNPYNVAMADWFHAPEIKNLDIDAWSGQAGQLIRVEASDDVKITQVTVVITDESDVLLEQGSAEQGPGLWWEYVTTATASGNPKVIVSAQDLPGHIANMTKSK